MESLVVAELTALRSKLQLCTIWKKCSIRASLQRGLRQNQRICRLSLKKVRANGGDHREEGLEIAKLITKQIVSASSWENVMFILDRHSDDINTRHATTALFMITRRHVCDCIDYVVMDAYVYFRMYTCNLWAKLM